MERDVRLLRPDRADEIHRIVAQRRRAGPAAEAGSGTEAALVDGKDGMAGIGGIAVERGEGGAVVAEAAEGDEQLARRPCRLPAVQGQVRAVAGDERLLPRARGP